MADFVFCLAQKALEKLASFDLAVNRLPCGEIKKLKETMFTILVVLLEAEERQTNSEALIWLKKLEEVMLNASDLLDEIELWSQGSAGRKLCRFFSFDSLLVFHPFRIGGRIKNMRERIDEIAAERDRVNLVSIPTSEREFISPQNQRIDEIAAVRDLPANKMPVRRHVGVPAASGFAAAKDENVYQVEKIRTRVRLIIARIDKLNDKVTCSKLLEVIEERAKEIVYVVACVVAVCVDPFFLYIPFLSLSKMCFGMNRELWKVLVALRTVADFFTALILFMSINRPQLSRCMSSIKLILLMCVFAPIPQILFSEKFILKTLGGHTLWNLILFCHYGARLVLIFQACEQLKTMVSGRTFVRFMATVYLFLVLIVSHVIGASWYYLSIKRQLSCWNYACKNITGCIMNQLCLLQYSCTTPSALNSTLGIEFCPLNRQKFGIFLDALESGTVEDKGVRKKFLQCFFWGLRNLSSFASNLHTSSSNGETVFAIIISAGALILLIYILASISFQRYSELESARSERIVDNLESARSVRIVGKMEPIIELIECLVLFHNLDYCTKKSIVEHIQEAFENGYKSFNLERLRINRFLNDVTKTESLLKDLRFLEEWVLNGQPANQGKAKKWLSDNNIPPDQNNILFYLTCRLRDDEEVNLTSVRSVLPDKSKWWMTMKDLCFDTLKKVPGLQNIDEEWFKSISSILKPVIYPEGSYLFVQGKPLDYIIFITNGVALGYTTISDDARGHSSGNFSLWRVDFFGAELIKWRSESDLFGVPGSSKSLEKGDFFGGEIAQWKLRRPISTADVQSLTQVEAFVLTIQDLALSSDFPVDSSSRTEEGSSVQRTEEGASVQRTEDI